MYMHEAITQCKNRKKIINQKRLVSTEVVETVDKAG